MNTRNDSAVRATHRIAAEINRVMPPANLTNAKLANEIGESERFIRTLLEGEDGLSRRIHVDLLVRIGDAVGMDVSFRFIRRRNVKTLKSVESGDK